MGAYRSSGEASQQGTAKFRGCCSKQPAVCHFAGLFKCVCCRLHYLHASVLNSVFMLFVDRCSWDVMSGTGVELQFGPTPQIDDDILVMAS